MGAGDTGTLQTPAQLERRGDGSVLLRFPSRFAWGSGISAHQTEGGNDNTDWWDFEQRGHIANGEVSGRATDFWNRYHTDIELAQELGHNAMKISVEWARIEPEPGIIDEAAIAHYRDILTAMRKAGIEPFVTLHHFTNPMWLEAYKWWLGRETPGIFARYCRETVGRLGDLVGTWCTINEPVLIAAVGYGTGTWPPEKRGWPNAIAAYDRLIEGHRLAYAAVKDVLPHSSVGVCTNAVHVVPHAEDWGDRALRAPANWLGNLRFLNRVRGVTDFIGMQYYSRICPRRVFDGTGRLDDADYGHGTSDMGWSIWPQGIDAVVSYAWHRYRIPILITENGIADAADTRRERFIVDHLAWLHRSMRNGADVRGYYHWATTDNFEWLDGFEKCFGLVEVDRVTLTRRVRESARAYAQICSTGELVVPDDHPSLAP